jgi:hypothetical protein
MTPEELSARQTAERKQLAASQAYELYDFMSHGVTEADGWDTSDARDYTRIAYVEVDGEESGRETRRVSFHVRFNEAGNVVEVYALDVATGNYVGEHPIVFVEIGDEGRVFEIDTTKLTRESGYVVIVAEFPGSGTQFVITTDVMDAMKRIRAAGGRAVDGSTNIEAILNEQYDGTAVFGTADF